MGIMVLGNVASLELNCEHLIQGGTVEVINKILKSNPNNEHLIISSCRFFYNFALQNDENINRCIDEKTDVIIKSLL